MPDIHKVSWPPRESLYPDIAYDEHQLQHLEESLQPRESSQHSEHGQNIEEEDAVEETKVTPKPFKPSVRAFLPFSQRIDPESSVNPESRSKPIVRRKRPKRRGRTQAGIVKAEARHVVPQLFTMLAKPRSSSVQIVPTTDGSSPFSALVTFLRQKYLDLVNPAMPRADVAAPHLGVAAPHRALQDDIVFALSAVSSIIIGTVLALPSS